MAYLDDDDGTDEPNNWRINQKKKIEAQVVENWGSVT